MNNNRRKETTDDLATLTVFTFIGYITTGVAHQVVLPLISNPEKLENMITRVMGIQLLKEGIIEMAGLGYGSNKDRRYY